MKSIPGGRFCFVDIRLHARKTAATRYFLFFLVSLWSADAAAQSAPPTPLPSAPETPAQSPSQTPLPPPQTSSQTLLPDTPPPPAPDASAENFLRAATPRAPNPFAPGVLPAARVPAIETRLAFSALSRVSSPNSRILYKGLNASATKQYSERLGGTLAMSYLRASNVFGTGRSNTILTYLIGPVFYPYRRSGLVTSLHALGGGARVVGVAGLTPSGYLKGSLNDAAWALGGGLEKWVTYSLALRLDVDALHTSFYNASMKVHGEYDLRASWGIVYYIGGRKRDGKWRSFAGKQLE